jgi:hypothetical protein
VKPRSWQAWDFCWGVMIDVPVTTTSTTDSMWESPPYRLVKFSLRKTEAAPDFPARLFCAPLRLPASKGASGDKKGAFSKKLMTVPDKYVKIEYIRQIIQETRDRIMAKALIVDDSKFMRRIIRAALEEGGHFRHGRGRERGGRHRRLQKT